MKKNKEKSIIAPVIFTLLGIAMVLYGVFNSYLAVVGKDTVAVITSSTYFHKKSSVSNTYSYDVSYKFKVNGKEYTGSGYITKQMYGGPTGSIKIKYFPAAPSLNEPSKGMNNNIFGMFLGGALLIILNIAIIIQERKEHK